MITTGKTSLEDIYLDTEFEDIEGLEILNTFPNVKGVPFDEATFQEFISNFEEMKQEKNPHLKIDHTSQQAILKALTGRDFEEGTELPNLGFIKKMYVKVRDKGTSLMADVTKVPKKLKPYLFDNKMFSAISPEASFNFRNSGKKVITAIALTNNPAQKHILNVHMNELQNNTTEDVGVGARESRTICFSGDIILQDGGIQMDASKNDTTTQATANQQVDDVVKTFSEKLSDFMNKLSSKKEEKPVVEPVKNSEAVVPLSEYNQIKGQVDVMLSEVNALKLALIEKDKAQKDFSEQLQIFKKETREEKAEAICKQAVLEGIPPAIVNYFRPILLSELGEQTIELSEKVDGKEVKANTPLTDFVKGFFKIYPNKNRIDFSDRLHTRVEEPGKDEDLELSEIEKRKTELMTQGMKEFDALEKATIEVKTKGGSK